VPAHVRLLLPTTFISKDEAAAVALRNRLAKTIGRLVLTDREIVALSNNYTLAVKVKQYLAAYEPKHPERPFLPPDLFDPPGPWVWFHKATAKPMARQHFQGAGGRAAHVIFLRRRGARGHRTASAALPFARDRPRRKSVMHDDTIFTTCERCNRGFNLSNPAVRLDGPTSFCPHCGQRKKVDAESVERASKFRGITS